jgi:hypothetical protein
MCFIFDKVRYFVANEDACLSLLHLVLQVPETDFPGSQKYRMFSKPTLGECVSKYNVKTLHYANTTAWNAMHSPVPSSPCCNVSHLIAPANGKCKPEVTANGASDGLCAVADGTVSAHSSSRYVNTWYVPKARVVMFYLNVY